MADTGISGSPSGTWMPARTAASRDPLATS
jgi:hypothetical protein